MGCGASKQQAEHHAVTSNTHATKKNTTATNPSEEIAKTTAISTHTDRHNLKSTNSPVTVTPADLDPVSKSVDIDPPSQNHQEQQQQIIVAIEEPSSGVSEEVTIPKALGLSSNPSLNGSAFVIGVISDAGHEVAPQDMAYHGGDDAVAVDNSPSSSESWEALPSGVIPPDIDIESIKHYLPEELERKIKEEEAAKKLEQARLSVERSKMLEGLLDEKVDRMLSQGDLSLIA